MTDDNQVILDRAADSCRALDDIRYKLYTIQNQLAQARTQSGGTQQQGTLSKANKDKAMTALLNEAYTLQFQIATLLASTEEPIPERQRRRPKQAQASSTPTIATTIATTTATTATTTAMAETETAATATATAATAAAAAEAAEAAEAAATAITGEPTGESIPIVVTMEQQPSTAQEIFDTTMASQVEPDVVVLDDVL
ncbi:hypothetical protein MVEG_09701 [Podila verticillata NRRL 6337]|nr:hypothetical protein MVEG_09701 [Podila verticillata NRRL 6337]